MGFQMLTWLWLITIGIRPTGWHALSRNKDWRMMYWPWTQKNGIRKRNPIRFSGNRSFKKVYASMSIPENPWFLQGGRRFEDGEACFCKRFLFPNLLPCLTVRWKGAQEYHHRLGGIASQTNALNRLKGMLSQLGLHTSDLEDLKLNFLTRMHTSTRYPSEDLPPVQLFDQSDGEECLEIAEKVINFTRTMKKGDG